MTDNDRERQTFKYLALNALLSERSRRYLTTGIESSVLLYNYNKFLTKNSFQSSKSDLMNGLIKENEKNIEYCL